MLVNKTVKSSEWACCSELFTVLYMRSLEERSRFPKMKLHRVAYYCITSFMQLDKAYSQYSPTSDEQINKLTVLFKARPNVNFRVRQFEQFKTGIYVWYSNWYEGIIGTGIVSKYIFCCYSHDIAIKIICKI